MPQTETATLSLARYAQDAKGWIASSQGLADERNHAEVTPLHLLARGIERHPGVVEVLRRAGVDVVDLGAAVERALSAVPRATGAAYLSNRFLELLTRAEREA